MLFLNLTCYTYLFDFLSFSSTVHKAFPYCKIQGCNKIGDVLSSCFQANKSDTKQGDKSWFFILETLFPERLAVIIFIIQGQNIGAF